MRRTMTAALLVLALGCDRSPAPAADPPKQTMAPAKLEAEPPKDPPNKTPVDATEPPKPTPDVAVDDPPKTADRDPDPEDDPLPPLDPSTLPPPPGPVKGYTPPTPAEIAAAAHETNRELCEKRWPAMKRTTPDQNRTCARFWVVHHGYAGHHDDFGLDPTAGTAAFVRLTARTLLVLAQRVRAYCGTDCAEVDDRAIELFQSNANYHYCLAEQNPDAPELSELLRVLLAGEPLEASLRAYELYPDETFDDLLARLSSVMLFRLRNAPYARHGRTFKHEDLQAFYYEETPAYPAAHATWCAEDRAKLGLLPLTVDPAYDDAKLTKVDHENIARIRAAETRVRGEGR